MSIEHFNSDLDGRPQLIRGDTQTISGGMTRQNENSLPNLKRPRPCHSGDRSVKSWGRRVIVSQGGAFRR
jgi:hypothetical protein